MHKKRRARARSEGPPLNGFLWFLFGSKASNPVFTQFDLARVPSSGAPANGDPESYRALAGSV